ncbi:MAG: hypothetical protein EBU12_10120 [Microbacteriaceae bacterium]|nr:hypothetical protein [Microbacteriaceae bacterium]
MDSNQAGEKKVPKTGQKPEHIVAGLMQRLVVQILIQEHGPAQQQLYLKFLLLTLQLHLHLLTLAGL